MKKLIYGVAIVAIAGVTIISCSKDQNPVSSTKSSPSSGVVEKIGPGIRIFKVTPHRPVGKVNNQGVSCDCISCAGFCDFEWFPSSLSSDPTIGVDFGTAGIARIYFFSALDVDSKTNPVFYIDEDVKVHDNNGLITIPNGQYAVKVDPGKITVGGNDFSYYSYIEVPYTVK